MTDPPFFRGCLKLEIIQTIMKTLEEHGVDFESLHDPDTDKIRPFVANLANSLDHVIEMAMQRLETK